MKTYSLKHSIHMCLLAAALATPIAFAQDTAPPPAPPVNAPMHEGSVMHDSAMKNDGMAAPAPMPPIAKSVSWKDLDANKDGKLSRDEVAGQPMRSEHFDAADTNKDGFLSKAEFKKHDAEMKKMDKRAQADGMHKDDGMQSEQK